MSNILLVILSKEFTNDELCIACLLVVVQVDGAAQRQHLERAREDAVADVGKHNRDEQQGHHQAAGVAALHAQDADLRAQGKGLPDQASQKNPTTFSMRESQCPWLTSWYS